VTLIEAYESKHFPMSSADQTAAIKFICHFRSSVEIGMMFAQNIAYVRLVYAALIRLNLANTHEKGRIKR
jgi:hypothetical protein